jgi:hypothetical protein
MQEKFIRAALVAVAVGASAAVQADRQRHDEGFSFFPAGTLLQSGRHEGHAKRWGGVSREKAKYDTRHREKWSGRSREKGGGGGFFGRGKEKDHGKHSGKGHGRDGGRHGGKHRGSRDDWFSGRGRGAPEIFGPEGRGKWSGSGVREMSKERRSPWGARSVNVKNRR